MTNTRDMADNMIVLPSIGKIEDRVIRDVHKRLAMGASTYGLFQETDPRNMDREAYEEVLDGMVYQSLKLYQRMNKGGD